MQEYCWEKDITYSNNLEYRKVLRQLCNMSKENYKHKIDILQNKLGSELDDITRDENEYDEYAIEKALNYIYNKTKKRQEFMDLYRLAASKMISTDVQIGLAVCLSYDYLKAFHYCFQSYMKDPAIFNPFHKTYTDMQQLLL